MSYLCCKWCAQKISTGVTMVIVSEANCAIDALTVWINLTNCHLYVVTTQNLVRKYLYMIKVL